jgi:hypothetical protein
MHTIIICWFKITNKRNYALKKKDCIMGFSTFMGFHLRNSPVFKPGIVAHAYNPNYLEGKDQNGHSLRTAQTKNISKIPSQRTSQAW